VYSISTRRSFVADHFLIGGDWGAENARHSHSYRAVVILRGTPLDDHGFLVDLTDLNARVDRLTKSFAGLLLNDLPPFQGLNPSLEHFSRILAHGLASQLSAENVAELEVQLWEDDAAWASFLCILPCGSD
jgi:6-pyruvoyltetrahydropterin/6-carboxytetrahydropterin synthase